MPLDIERVVDRCMRLKKALRRRPALKSLHLSLSSSNDEMRILGAIVVAQSARPVTIAKTKSGKCCTIRSQSIRDDYFWLDMLVLQ